MLPNPFWSALSSEQAGIAIGSFTARRYPADVLPFAGIKEATPAAMNDLHGLLAPGEAVYITGYDLPSHLGLQEVSLIPGWQMHLIAKCENEQEACPDEGVRSLGAEDADRMVALTNVAFPGFFRAGTYSLGQYLGIEIDGELVAMAGERIAVPGAREISAVCTHPDHTGRGYAARLIQELIRRHKAAGIASFLHVSATNQRAIALYERLGFEKSMQIIFRQMQRSLNPQT